MWSGLPDFPWGHQILDLKQILYMCLGSTSTNMDPAVGEVGFTIFAWPQNEMNKKMFEKGAFDGEGPIENEIV